MAARHYQNDIINELNNKLQIPGVTNGWTREPIINRINISARYAAYRYWGKVYGPKPGYHRPRFYANHQKNNSKASVA